MALILSIQDAPDRALKDAVQQLQNGAPIAIPTETVYGLAADATNPDAITSIYQTKGRPSFNPLICHMSNLAMAKDHVDFDPLSEKLAKQFWPGALTLILPLRADSTIHKLASAGLSRVGVRVPLGFSAELISHFGKPLAAPSANSSGKISPTTALHVDQDLGNKIELILDQGACHLGLESTIIKVARDRAHLLRPGAIAAQDIETVIGTKLIRIGETSDIEAPGMLTSHYAPDASVRLHANHVAADEVLIKFGTINIEGEDHAISQYNLSETGDLVEAAHNLFDMLIMADRQAKGKMAISPIPNQGLGEAINDRLKRAAAPR